MICFWQYLVDNKLFQLIVIIIHKVSETYDSYLKSGMDFEKVEINTTNVGSPSLRY